MSDAADRLAQAIRDVINEAVQAAVGQERPTAEPARVAERPKMAEEGLDPCPWCNKKHMRHLMPVEEARHQLGGISPTTFYALVKDGDLSLVKIGRRSFVQAEDLDDFVRRKRYDPIWLSGSRATPSPANGWSLSGRACTTATSWRARWPGSCSMRLLVRRVASPQPVRSRILRNLRQPSHPTLWAGLSSCRHCSLN